ncbi:class I SAM-dependent methyltransferase [Roseibium algae]|uniref:Class I SAM-dependent methyltransferase n=1 Tax=Roseibium algae TaxID=3123038 RepID=A0ABU8TP67_9HYPH
MSDGNKLHSDAFLARRDAARARIDVLTGAKGGDAEDRQSWFRTVYQEAGGDPAAVAWADLAPKQVLIDWLQDNPAHHHSSEPGDKPTAVDVACGLGDNAEALSHAGYVTTAFDFVPEAIDWAKQRFPESAVDYIASDLFALPPEWVGAFDLVHECYTVQAMASPLRDAAIPALASLVAPGGTLLFINRSREEGTEADGPPWPVMPSEWRAFEKYGLELVDHRFYDLMRPGRVIPHVIAVFKRHEGAM